jgi:hypothetical protein
MAGAALLLVAALVLAGLAGRNWQQPAATAMPVRSVVAPEVIANRVVEDHIQVVASFEKLQPDAVAATEPADPNLVWNERTAAAVGHFVAKYGLEGETFNKPQLLRAIRARAAQWGDAALAADFAQGLAIATEQTLTDPRLLKLFATSAAISAAASGSSNAAAASAQQAPRRLYQGSPAHVVNDLVETYALQFAATLEKQPGERAKKAFDAATARASTMTQIVLAVSALSACLMLVCIAIVLRLAQAMKTDRAARLGTDL